MSDTAKAAIAGKFLAPLVAAATPVLLFGGVVALALIVVIVASSATIISFGSHTDSLATQNVQCTPWGETSDDQNAESASLTANSETGSQQWQSSITDLSVSQYTTAIDIPDQYVDLVTEAAQTAQFPPEVIAATLQTESDWQADALSDAGATGIGQFMPATWQGLIDQGLVAPGANALDPADAIPAMGEYLRHLRNQVEPASSSIEETVELTLAAYNAGPGQIAELDYDSDYFPNETRQYIVNIFWMLNGAEADISRASSDCAFTGDVASLAELGCEDATLPTSTPMDPGGMLSSIHPTGTVAAACGVAAFEDLDLQVSSVHRPGDPLDHGTGRAIDWAATGWSGSDLTYKGHGLSQSGVDTHSAVSQFYYENAPALNVRYIIWLDQMWHCTDTDGKWSPYNGNSSSPSDLHINHVHISLDRTHGSSGNFGGCPSNPDYDTGSSGPDTAAAPAQRED